MLQVLFGSNGLDTGYWKLKMQILVKFLMKGKTKLIIMGKAFAYYCDVVWCCLSPFKCRKERKPNVRSTFHAAHIKQIRYNENNRNKDHLKAIPVPFFIHSFSRMRCTECNEWHRIQWMANSKNILFIQKFKCLPFHHDVGVFCLLRC